MTDTTLPNQHGPGWAATDDAELIAALGARLAELGGERFLTPPAGLDVLVWRVVREGVASGAQPLSHFDALAGCERAYGWALNDDGMWRPHTWGITADGTIVETATGQVGYLGVVLTAQERSLLAPGGEASDMVKVHISFDEDDGPGGESMWATPVEGGYRIENVPFFAEGFTLGSVVTADRNHRHGLEISGVVSHLHAGGVTILFDDDVAEGSMVAVVARLRDQGVRVERAAGVVWVGAVPLGGADAVREILDSASCAYELTLFDEG